MLSELYCELLNVCNNPTDVETLALNDVNTLAVDSTKSNLLSNELLSFLYCDELNVNKDALTLFKDCEVAIYELLTLSKDELTLFKDCEVVL